MDKLCCLFILSLILISCSRNKIQSDQNIKEHIKNTPQTKANLSNDSLGYWIITNYTDEFDEPTDKQYIALKSEKGIFSTPGTTDSDLDVVIAVDEEHSEIRLFKHRGDYQTKLMGYINFKIKESNGEIHDIKTFDGSTFRQKTTTTDSLFRTILSRGGELKFTATVSEYGSQTKYNFTIPNCDHFLDALSRIVNKKK